MPMAEPACLPHLLLVSSALTYSDMGATLAHLKDLEDQLIGLEDGAKTLTAYQDLLDVPQVRIPAL